VRRGLAGSRQQAQAAIEAGRVTVAGAPATKAARLVDPGEAVAVAGPAARFVGRGGDKLDAALARFAIEARGRMALDVGASTGGFTDCLLQRGAASVLALDVGYGQLHERLRRDDRVVVLERTNIRDVRPGDLGAAPDIVVADLSFISLRVALPSILALCPPGADLVLLVKPQFEAGRAEAAKGRGVITDPVIWQRVLQEVAGALDSGGAAIMAAMPSPITGADGNVEFLLHCRAAARGAAPAKPLLLGAVAEAVAARAGSS